MFQRVRVSLLEVGFLSFLVILPDHITGQILDHMPPIAGPRAFGSLYEFTHVVGTTINLAAHAVQVDTVLHCEVDAEVIILVTGHTALTGAKADSAHRFQAGEPGKDINVVYMLFYDVITGKPFPVDPVTHHELKIAPSRLAITIPEHALVPVDGSPCDLTDKTIHDLFVGLHITTLVVALCTGYHTQVLGLCLFGSSHDGAVSHSIHADRFLQKSMFVFFHRIFEVFGPEVGRCTVDQQIDVTVDHLFVGIKAHESFLSRYINILLCF